MSENELSKVLTGLGFSPITKSDVATERFTIPTPSLDLNRILLGDLYKGLQSRSVVGIVGPEGTFKSSFVSLTMSEASKHGYTPVIIDSEGSYTPDFISRWGLEPDNTYYQFCNFIEDVKKKLYGLIKSGHKKFIVGIDSLAGLDKEKIFTDLDKGDPKADMGALAKDIKSMYKFIVALAKLTDSIVVVTSHMYSGTGLFPTQHVSGGSGILYFSDVLIKLKKGKMEDKDKNIYGNLIKAQTIKNRFYPPFQEATIQLDYKNGINRYAGLVDLLIECGEIEKGGSWLTFKDGTKVQGAIKAEEILKDRPDLLDGLNEYLKKTGYSKQSEDLVAESEKMLNTFTNSDSVFDDGRDIEKEIETDIKEINNKTTKKRNKG